MMNIYSIPNTPFLEHVVQHLIPFESCDFKGFLSYRLVSRKFNEYFTNCRIFKQLNKKFGLVHKESFYDSRAEYWATIFRVYIKYYNTKFPTNLVQVFNGIQGIYELPVLHCVDWWVLSRFYSCHNMTDRQVKKRDPWNKLKRKMKYPIMRGVDTGGRHFIAFKYYNYTLKCHHLEILYRDFIKVNRAQWTFIGEHNFTFIGGIGLENNIYRSIMYLNYDFLDYILKNKKMFLANKIDTLSHPVKARYPIKPMHNDYWSDDDSEEEFDSDMTLNKITENTYMLSLEY